MINVNEDWIAYIPNRMESQDPKMRFLSRNILFGKYIVRGGKPVLASALYEPDCESLDTDVKDAIVCIFMNYYNQLDNRGKVILKCYLSKNGSRRYEAIKYFNEAQLGLADGGDNWERFFTQVALLGLVADEKVEYTDLQPKHVISN